MILKKSRQLIIKMRVLRMSFTNFDEIYQICNDMNKEEMLPSARGKDILVRWCEEATKEAVNQFLAYGIGWREYHSGK
jgi:hypothetical protein